MSQPLKGVKPRWHWLAIIALAFGLFLVGLDRIPVPTVDGAVRAAMARNVIRSGELWPITYEGRVFTDHPPLYVWLTALSFKIFGMNDFAANLVPRLFAALTVLMTAAIALQAGFSRGVALASAIILCCTRDYVLSSVRGYIEPVLEFFIYLAVYLTLRGRAAGAGVAVWLAAYSKGPVALWPFLFCAWFLRTLPKLSRYLGAFVACTVVWATWVNANHHWPYWARYLNQQVLGSALEGRGGAQRLEPFYFVSILAQYYWPWLPLFVLAIVKSLKPLKKRKIEFTHVMLLLALGFIGGFSIMKWKFWYYIAPAYPAMSILIAVTFQKFYARQLDRERTAQGLALVGALWIVVASFAPIRLHHERVPEVLAFKDTIVNSNVSGAVWYVNDPIDHNMVGTSGQWYFDRVVVKVENEVEWERTQLKAPAWVITGADHWKECSSSPGLGWCHRSRRVLAAGHSVLASFGF